MLTRPMHNDMPPMGTALQPAMLDQRGRQRRRRGWQRRILRGAIGIFGLLTLWAAMSEYYGLALILPPPWTVFHDIFDTLTLDYRSPWMYGPNIYQHLAASFARAIVGFTLAAAAAIPCGLLVGRSRAMREFLEPVIKLLYRFQESPGSRWRFCGSA